MMPVSWRRSSSMSPRDVLRHRDASQGGASSRHGGPGAEDGPDMLEHGNATEHEYEERLRSLYAQVNPEKLSTLPSIFAKYDGQLADVYASVCKKYRINQGGCGTPAAHADNEGSSTRLSEDKPGRAALGVTMASVTTQSLAPS